MVWRCIQEDKIVAILIADYLNRTQLTPLGLYKQHDLVF